MLETDQDRRLASLRRQFGELARRHKSRLVPRSREHPCDWKPHTVTNPATGQPFTDDEAWQFISAHLKLGCEIEEIVLEQPEGKMGYVVKLEGIADKPFIYVKLQAVGAKVYGRSFHYDDRNRRK